LLYGLFIYLGLGGLALLFQKALTYHPQTAQPADEAILDSTPWLRQVRFTTSDGIQLHGVWVPPDEGKAVLLLSHGNAGNLFGRIPLVERLRRQGLGVFLYDYRGYGRSPGSPGEEGLYRDVEAAWEWVTSEGEIPSERLVSYGRSLGAAVALHLAVSRPVGGVILEVPFTSIRDMARQVLPFFPSGAFLRESYDNLQLIESLSRPLLIMVAEGDQVVAPWMGKTLFAAAHEPKRLLVVPGAGHDDIPWTETLYPETLNEFLSTLSPEPE
ncbi:MAG: alpha/beta fold hydrolase, partial [Acidobacteriota bacterium]